MVATTETMPAVPTGIVHVIVVELPSIGEEQVVPPILAVTPVKNPVPVIVIVAPPASGLELGVILVTVGATTNE